MLKKIKKYKIYNIDVLKISLILFAFTLCVIAIGVMCRVGETEKEIINIAENEFSGSSGIISGGEIFTDANGLSKMYITVKNISGKNINEIKIYMNLIDINGEVTEGEFLRYDKIIMPNETKRITHTFSYNKFKKVETYIYDVSFEDGTEWGNKDASKSKILEKSYKINIVGVSEKQTETDRFAVR